MPTIKTLVAKTAVNASQPDVFAAVTNWSLQDKWIFATKVLGVGEDSHTLGGKLEAFTGFGPIGFLDTMTITTWDPPYICEVTHTGKIVKGSGIFEVTSENNVTYFTWTEVTEIPFGLVGRVGWLVVGPMTKFGMKISLRRFKKLF